MLTHIASCMHVWHDAPEARQVSLLPKWVGESFNFLALAPIWKNLKGIVTSFGNEERGSGLWGIRTQD